MNKKQVYLDFNATSIPYDKALKEAEKTLKIWGNPSSSYQMGAEAKNILWEARQALAQFINCHPLEVIFTSGASEANNFAIKGLFENIKPTDAKSEIIVSKVEHPSVMAVVDYLSSKGFKIHKVPVSKEGILDEDFFDKVLSEKTFLVSIMLANNETGVLFPIKKLAQKAHSQGAIFHSDMVQGLSKLPIDVRDLDVDLASFSAHKSHALKGCGFLYSKKGIEIKSLIHGGPQERNRRAGTENLVSIAAFGLVAKEKDFFLNQNDKVKSLRDNMEKQILSKIPNVKVIGQKSLRLPNTSSFLIEGIKGESLLMNLDLKGFCVSVGSACSSGRQEGSTVLASMGFTENEAKACLRVSLSYQIEEKDTNAFVETLQNSVEAIRSL